MNVAEAAESLDTIPDDNLLERPTALAASKPGEPIDINSEAFHWEQLKSYVNADNPDFKWNEVTKKQHIIINNFDTLIGNPGHGHELVALVAEKKQLNGNYNPSEPVRKYHEWAKSQYDIPDTKKEIKNRIIEITGDEKYNRLVKQVYKAYNTMVSYGNVPEELFESDARYWLLISGIAVCRDTQDCDVKGLEELLVPLTPEEIAEYENQLNTDESDGSLFEYVIPQAFAWDQQDVYHSLYAWIEPYSCTDGYGFECRVTINTITGIGELSDSETYPGDHMYTEYMKTYALSCSSGEPYAMNEISVTVDVGPEFTFDDDDYGCADVYENVRVGNSNGAPHSFSTVRATSDAWKWV